MPLMLQKSCSILVQKAFVLTFIPHGKHFSSSLPS
jgi:hypothetical protein